jgi:hypothetical protein
MMVTEIGPNLKEVLLSMLFQVKRHNHSDALNEGLKVMRDLIIGLTKQNVKTSEIEGIMKSFFGSDFKSDLKDPGTKL